MGYLVFEYVDHTVLEELEDHPKGLPIDTARNHIYQVLKGIEFCHQNNILHRDVKPENVLVSKLGVVKLCDFGFARLMAAPGEVYTDYVATRWYRAPELLIGDTQYGKEVDIWAIGCLYAEMASGDPLFPGESDIDQLFQITKLMGPLSSKHRQMISKNPMFNGLSIPNQSQKSLKSLFPNLSDECLSFLKICLNLEPSTRTNCTDLLKSSLFTCDNFHITFPNQLKAKIQYEFGNQPIGTHKKLNFTKKIDNDSRIKENPTSRRRLNSDVSESVITNTNVGSQDLVARNLSISTIYGSKITEDPGQRSTKIIAPPASLTSDMHERKASAQDCEIQIISPIRQVHAVSPDESSMASPVRLKRYEGFEQGLNVMGRSRGAPYRNNNPSTNLRNKSPPMKKSKRKETTLENLNINFGPPATPNEKKTSNESTERFIFLEKAFDKAFQLEDSMPSPEPPLVDSDSVRKQSANSKFNSEGNSKHGGYKSHAVLTAIEPLSLPSVMGSKTNMGLFGSSNNPENVKNQSQKTVKSRTQKKNQFLNPDENIHMNISRPPSHNLPYV